MSLCQRRNTSSNTKENKRKKERKKEQKKQARHLCFLVNLELNLLSNISYFFSSSSFFLFFLLVTLILEMQQQLALVNLESPDLTNVSSALIEEDEVLVEDGVSDSYLEEADQPLVVDPIAFSLP